MCRQPSCPVCREEIGSSDYHDELRRMYWDEEEEDEYGEGEEEYVEEVVYEDSDEDGDEDGEREHEREHEH